jgi:hypothetical protein
MDGVINFGDSKLMHAWMDVINYGPKIDACMDGWSIMHPKLMHAWMDVINYGLKVDACHGWMD